MKKQTGFTIVELLIVIVVIGILAAITIVAFNGIQDRARNSRMVSVANSYRKSLIAFATENGRYPASTATGACLGEASNYPSGCAHTGVSANFNTELQTYLKSTLPNPPNDCLPMYTGCRTGASYFYYSTMTLDSAVHPWSIVYYLKGAESCQGSGLAGGTFNAATSTPNASGFVERHSNTTLCRLLLPDPTSL